MLEISENTVSVIKQSDPDLPKYLDFKNLRREGLEHIGNLTGKIWTDHNVHDPGITILEVLVYALIDLGYKTNLPFKDLIAREDHQDNDDNFLTPLEAFTVNPVTITDYRKLLLDIKGVRNVWLEPVNQEVNLFINQDINALSCLKPVSPNTDNVILDTEGGVISVEGDDCSIHEDFKALHLNGLYKIYVEKENDVVNEGALIREVKERFLEHRNLCEDYTDIKILEPVDFGVCVNVEILTGYDAKAIYSKIIKAIKNAIQPEIKYYTLNQLLDKGKAIDDIFAGRPYSEKSFGFVDTDELEKLKKRKEIHLSDLYHTILSIEGVKSIKKLHVNKAEAPASLNWKQKIEPCEVFKFSLEKTCVDIYNEQGLIQIDKPKIHKSFSFSKKFELPLSSLNSEIPFGNYNEDLSDYYSIQNDFPVVYGIGEDGLPESATLLRKTQALQLKGYLMFYDQILANYSSQLANIRSLFSLKSEQKRTKEEKKTYFTQIPESISGIEDLLRFYDTNAPEQHSSVLAYPVLDDDVWKDAVTNLEKNPRAEFSIGNACETKSESVGMFTFSSVNNRSIYINQIIDAFNCKNYTIQILEDRFGCFFVLRPSLPNNILIIGTKRYESLDKARVEAKNVAFIASTRTSYNLVTNKSETNAPDRHYFGIVYHPKSYINLIQEITENKEEYVTRRKQFLDHLLARFGEEFTDYALLQYKGKLNEFQRNEKMIKDQSSYVNEFAELSRNRGKAFNYLEPSWNTNNVSGLEKRVSLLSGINNYKRRNLCNFEVTECYRLLLKDPNGIPLLRSNRSFETKAELHHAARKVLLQLRNSNTYNFLEKHLNGFNAKALGRIFSEQPTEEHIIITKYRFNQQLINNDGKVVGHSKNINSKNAAFKTKGEFLKLGGEQTLPNLLQTNKNRTYRLLPLEKDNHYFDVTDLDTSLKINLIESWKWHITTKSKEKLESEVSFKGNTNAWDDVISSEHLDDYLVKHNTAYRWILNIQDQQISFKGLNCYPDKNKATVAWRKARVLGSDVKNYTLEREENTKRLLLKNEKKKIIAISEKLKKGNANTIKSCTEIFADKNIQPMYVKETDKLGFAISVNKNSIPLVSYCAYDSKKETLQAMNKVFKLGKTKKNYLESGDEGNPEYNFLLRDTDNSFLALPVDHFEIAANRNKVLNTTLRFFKDNEAPVLVKKEPNKYTWTLFDTGNTILKSEAEFSSKARAKSNFDKAIASEALKSCYELCKDHIYKFDVIATPSQFKFIYGNTNEDNELNPVFMSEPSYESEKLAKKAYTDFVKAIPQLSLKVSKKNKDTFEYALYNKNTPIAIQYKKGSVKGDLNTAKELTNYLKEIYKDHKTPNEEFVISHMSESEQKSYEWRFYKKNAPIAKHSYLCEEKENAEVVKRIICDIIPPINLEKCPTKDSVVCPDKAKKNYHYQICFNDNKGNEFLLISYVGYKTKQEAENAWESEWLQVIDFARNPEQYSSNGKISLVEQYKNPESKSCNDTSFIAVIPENRKTDKNNQELIDHYVQLANLFPLYSLEITEEDEEKSNVTEPFKQKYKYRVVISDKDINKSDRKLLIESGCKPTDENEYVGTLIWDSVDCFNSITEAQNAYRHFYTLAGTPNNCRTLNENDKFYIGLVEVLAESSCDFKSKEEAWDDAFPSEKNTCGECEPKGVRAFVYAAEEDENYIPICDKDYWKFKVVAPSYFVVNHNCWYNSECERDHQKNEWFKILKALDWKKYTTDLFFENDNSSLSEIPLTHVAKFNPNKELFAMCCDMVHDIRQYLKKCSKGVGKTKQLEEVEQYLNENHKIYKCTEEEIKQNLCTDEKLNKYKVVTKLLDLFKSDVNTFYDLINYFPIQKTDEGYCYRLYWEENDKMTTEEGLQPCGCGSEVEDVEDNSCDEIYPFISSNCYKCCSEAFDAFKDFCALITNKKTYDIAPVSKTKNGPYSFKIVDTSRVLAYHPQQYKCLQEVEDAIEITKNCVDNAGMHLLEHILLRPNSKNQCKQTIFTGDDVALNNEAENCLLPICPDYCCDIVWQPDMDKDDPCSKNTEKNNTYYLPGTDPYSFWATVALPGWVKQFRTNESRQIFEKLLYKEAPALVGLNILWLSPSNMCKFEDEYRKWLESIKSSKKDSYENIKSPMCNLTNCISTLKSEEVCPSTPGKQGDCDCKSEEWVNDDECCMPNETNGSLFWACCETLEDTPPLVLKSTTLKEKSTKKDIKPKKPIKKVKKEALKEIDLLTLVRKRKPKYLSSVKALTDNNILKTKSYERTLFFLQNIPTVKAYNELVSFFKRYSLQKDNDISGFLNLLKNATWHLLDNIVLNQKTVIKTEDLDSIKTNFQDLKRKGLSLEILDEKWNIEEVKPLANIKSLNQIKKILK